MKRNNGVVSLAAVEPLLRMAGGLGRRHGSRDGRIMSASRSAGGHDPVVSRSMGTQRAMRSSLLLPPLLGELRDAFWTRRTGHQAAMLKLELAMNS